MPMPGQSSRIFSNSPILVQAVGSISPVRIDAGFRGFAAMVVNGDIFNSAGRGGLSRIDAVKRFPGGYFITHGKKIALHCLKKAIKSIR